MRVMIGKATASAVALAAVGVALSVAGPAPAAEAASYCYGSYLNNRTASWTCINTVGNYRAVGRCQNLLPFWETRTVYGPWKSGGAASWVYCNGNEALVALYGQ